MFSNGRMVAVALVSLGFGFVGGAWFIGSGLGFDLIPLPTVPPDYARPAAPTPKRVTPPPGPRVKAVEVPSPAKFDGHLFGLEPRADRNDLIPAPGCDWVIDPRRYTSSTSWTAMNEERALWGYPAVQPSTGALLYILIQSTRRGNAAIQLRPVFFDQVGTRYLRLSRTYTVGLFGGQFLASEFTLGPLEPLPRDKIAYFGIERIGPDADRLLAEAAHKAAKEQGVAILPRPEVGRPYRFDLITADGQRIRTEDFRGKAIVVWAWGTSLLNHWLHFDLKRIRDRYIDNELAFVGISFDDSVEEARTKFAQSKTDGSLVVVPNEPKIRRLWHDGAQITRLPAYFLIDRDGNLQDIGSFFQLKNNVDIRFGRWKPFLSDRPKFGPPRLPPRPGNIAPPSQPAAPKK